MPCQSCAKPCLSHDTSWLGLGVCTSHTTHSFPRIRFVSECPTSCIIFIKSMSNSDISLVSFHNTWFCFKISNEVVFQAYYVRFIHFTFLSCITVPHLRPPLDRRRWQVEIMPFDMIKYQAIYNLANRTSTIPET